MTRYAMQAAVRDGAVTLLTQYASDANIKLQVYRARPRSINPPCAFVDLMRETLTPFTVNQRQRLVTAELLVLHGLFDSGEAVDQRDAFVDGFADWVADNFHAFGANTDGNAVAIDDDPTYTPNWLPESEQRTYYATRITLEGLAAT